MKCIAARLWVVAFLSFLPVVAQATLTVQPITWNIIGLDSNDPLTGPNTFPVGVRVRGSVTTPTGAAANGIEVFALDASGNRVAGATTHDGEFTVVVAPGTYRFVAIDPTRRYGPAEMSPEVTIVQGQTPVPIALTLQAASRRRAVRH